MKLQRLLSYVRRAVDDFGMINDGDKVAVGVSGGKDSLTLLLALAHLRRFYPRKFDLAAITVDIGETGGTAPMDFSGVADFCRSLDVAYHVVKTDIADIIFDKRKEKNPCSLCAKMRKGALNDKALELGCHKVAVGHNMDDVTETFFMSLFYEGRIHTFSPVTYMDRKDITTVRPLIYAPEKEIISFVRHNKIHVVKNTCVVDGHTKRQEIKELISRLNGDFANLDAKVFGAILRSGISGWGGNSLLLPMPFVHDKSPYSGTTT